MIIQASKEVFKLKNVFTISRGSRTYAEVVKVTLKNSGFEGVGECVPYKRYNETIDSVLEQINKIKNIESRDHLQSIIQPGAARNALDCALIDLEAKTNGITAWQILNLPEPKPVLSAYTLSLSSPKEMANEAKLNSKKSVLKIKLGGSVKDIERVEAVKNNAPNSKIIVDANESWSINDFSMIEPKFAALGVCMIEQPFRVNEDHYLENVKKTIPICADESCHTVKDLSKCYGKYDVINIKLDKTGGLSEALKLKKQALKLNFDVMVGCMIGSSLSMAPAFLITDGAKWVDLDAPMLISKDRENSIFYKEDMIYPATKNLWG